MPAHSIARGSWLFGPYAIADGAISGHAPEHGADLCRPGAIGRVLGRVIAQEQDVEFADIHGFHRRVRPLKILE